ncbi:MAG: hypothetical protein N3G74_02290 [Candidatus Micrarchaeota archaeon]|nr:hypothetical protein [Candidatus Micrarchaeota archaeon]
MIEILRILIAVCGTGIAAYYDIFNRKNVPEAFLYLFLAISLVVNIFEYNLFLQFLPIALPLLMVLYLLYKSGQLGGADVFVIAAIYAAVPVFPMAEERIMPSILMILAIATMLASIWIMLKYLPKMARKFMERKVKVNVLQWLQVVALAISFAILSYLFVLFPFFPFWIFLVAILLFVESVFFIIFKEHLVEEMILMKSKIEPEDVLAVEKIDENTVRKYGIKRLTDEKQAKTLNKLRRKWPVLDMPMFLPFIFIGLIVYLIIGLISF